jgi:PEGA domain-containing protein
MSKNPVLVLLVIATVVLPSLAQTQTAQPRQSPPPPTSQPNTTTAGPRLQDGTPLKLRMGSTVSSATAHIGDSVDLEVLEEISVNNTVVIQKGATAIATVTMAQSKRSMGRAGKLDINIDYVRLADGEKAALRAVQNVKGGGHTGAMTGAMVATSLVFFPAAPLFLFMHGKDITIPKGMEVTAFVNGDMPLDLAKFQPMRLGPQTAMATNSATTELDISSVPDGAEINIDGKFAGNTPSTINVASGQHVVAVKMAAYQAWERTIVTSGGKVKLSAELVSAGEATGSDGTQAKQQNPAPQP